MALHQAFRARCVRKDGIVGEVRHGVTSCVLRVFKQTCNTSPPQGVFVILIACFLPNQTTHPSGWGLSQTPSAHLCTPAAPLHTASPHNYSESTTQELLTRFVGDTIPGGPRIMLLRSRSRIQWVGVFTRKDVVLQMSGTGEERADMRWPHICCRREATQAPSMEV